MIGPTRFSSRPESSVLPATRKVGQTYFLRGSENENHAALLDGMDIGSFEQNWPSNTISIANESLGDLQIKTGANDASSPAAMGMVINLASPVGSDSITAPSCI